MAWSPSSSSSCSSPPLPVMALRERIVEKVKENRVTLIVGDTGCGKSSQVPQFLLEENMVPILCTQPRRLAVVAIAKMVAEARNYRLGDEVGYHIGYSNVSTSSSKLVFKTAGVLLEQMRDKGLAALKFKVIILDEVHERSVESDLVLACVKQFMMRDNALRLELIELKFLMFLAWVILMSATADISRYRDYFKDLRKGEQVEVLAIPNAPKEANFQRKVLYLEQVSDLLGTSLEPSANFYFGVNTSSVDAEMNTEVHNLIHKLVLYLHENEPDIEKCILVFLPTYYSLEQQWVLLKPHFSLFKVHILHRSIDTEEALSAMKICKSHRKVILATNIAESSVTIPGVAFVIDSCRSLQVFWDHNRKVDAAELVWVSKSQAEQRKGRTGRTCDGEIYRLVTGAFYNRLNDHEYPSILRLSLRQQVLTICCAGSKAINDPKVLLQKVMDPPHPELVEDALSLLVNIQALKKLPQRRRYDPTFYGRLLDSLPLSFDASVLLLKFGDVGLLREGVLIAIFMDIQPRPILQPFGQQDMYAHYLDNYFEDDRGLLGKKETVFMGNLCAFYFWEHGFKDKHCLEYLKQISKIGQSNITDVSITKLEEEWCSLHNLVPTALHNVLEIFEDVLNIIHCFRPKFLNIGKAVPSYYESYGFRHKCLVLSEPTKTDAGNVDDVHASGSGSTCIASPFVSSEDFQAANVAENFAKLIKEIRLQKSEDTNQNVGKVPNDINFSDDLLCHFYIRGKCNKGDQCLFSHSLQATRTPCRFFLTLQGCRYGDLCVFSHDSGLQISPHPSQNACLPEEEIVHGDSFLRLLPTDKDRCVLILKDTDFQFTSKLSEYVDPKKIIITAQDLQPYGSEVQIPGVTKLLGGTQPWLLVLQTNGTVSIPWRKLHCVLWFADFDSNELETHKNQLKKSLESLAVRFLAESFYGVHVVITMNNVRFAQLQVEKLARDCFFFLDRSFRFDISMFGDFSVPFDNVRPLQVSLPISYVFSMHPPLHFLFKDYPSALPNGLYSGQ